MFKKIIALTLATFMLVACAPRQEETVLHSEQLTPSIFTDTGGLRVSSEGVVAPIPETETNIESTRLDIFFDPFCIHCANFELETSDFIKENINNGKFDVVYHPVAFLDSNSSDNYSTRAVNHLVEVAENSPEHFVPFMVALLENQPGSGPAYKTVTNEEIAEIAQSVGVPGEVTNNFKDLRYFEWVQNYSANEMTRTDLFNNDFGTPNVFVDGTPNNLRLEGAQKLDFQSAGGYLVALEELVK